VAETAQCLDVSSSNDRDMHLLADTAADVIGDGGYKVLLMREHHGGIWSGCCPSTTRCLRW